MRDGDIAFAWGLLIGLAAPYLWRWAWSAPVDPWALVLGLGLLR